MTLAGSPNIIIGQWRAAVCQPIDHLLQSGVAIGSFITNLAVGRPIGTTLGIATRSTVWSPTSIYALQSAAVRKQLGTSTTGVESRLSG